jgi:hypothetical protein
MGLACVQSYALSEAIVVFEEAKSILEQELGPYHPDTLGVYSNLAGTYDAIGRYPFFVLLFVFQLLVANIYFIIRVVQHFQFTKVLCEAGYKSNML